MAGVLPRRLDKAGLSVFADSVRPTKTGTLRISHTSSSHTLIGEKANKRRSFENASFTGKFKYQLERNRVLRQATSSRGFSPIKMGGAAGDEFARQATVQSPLVT